MRNDTTCQHGFWIEGAPGTAPHLSRAYECSACLRMMSEEVRVFAIAMDQNDLGLEIEELKRPVGDAGRGCLSPERVRGIRDPLAHALALADWPSLEKAVKVAVDALGGGA